MVLQNPYNYLIDLVQQNYKAILDCEVSLDEKKEESRQTTEQFTRFLMTAVEVKDLLVKGINRSGNMEISKNEGFSLVVKDLKEGVHLLNKALAALGIVSFTPETGAPFAPGKLYCVGNEKSDHLPDGTILNTVSEGYTWNNQLLRPAYVIVVRN